jgi:DNA-binding IclR family transcriptional regulator
VSARVQSIERGIDVLMTLAEGHKTLAEVTRATGLSKATAFRMLASLGYENVVVRNGDTAYMLGPGCLLLMQGVMRGLGAVTGAGRPTLLDLWERTGETVAIHVQVGTQRVCIEELPSRAAIRYTSTVGSSAPLHIGSAGRVLLAFTPAEHLERDLQVLQSAGEKIDEEFLRSQLEAIRAQGYALSEGERVPGAAAISAPVLGRHGFMAALSVLGPTFRLTYERRLELVPDLRRAAEAIGTALADAGRSGAEGET